MALDTMPHYTRTVIRKAVEINLHHNFKNRGGFQLSPYWKDIIQTVKQQRGCHNHTLPTEPMQDGETAITTP
jgi:hypothetical protein